MKRPEQIPEPVRAAVERWAVEHKSVRCTERSRTETVIVPELQWDSINGCYFFVRSGMWHGVELNGYIHT